MTDFFSIVIKFIPFIRDFFQGFKVEVRKVSFQDHSEGSPLITPYPKRYVVEVQLVNGHIPRLGVRDIRLTIDGTSYESVDGIPPLEQGDVHDAVLVFPTTGKGSCSGKYNFEFIDSRGKKYFQKGFF